MWAAIVRRIPVPLAWAAGRIPETLRARVSGEEFMDWGFEDDVALAAKLYTDGAARRLRGGAFSAVHSRHRP